MNAPHIDDLQHWDTHKNAAERMRRFLLPAYDRAVSALLEDLQVRGLLDSTFVASMGEFGRTPKINGQRGRDHWANSWSTVLAGGGIKGGQVIGKTSADGTTVEDRPVSVEDFLATIAQALGIDGKKQMSLGGPFQLPHGRRRGAYEIQVSSASWAVLERPSFW